MDPKRILPPLLLAAAVAISFPADASVDLLRSSRHLVRIEAQPAAGAAHHYAVIVFDAVSRSETARMHAVAKRGAIAEAEASADGARFTLRIAPYDESHLVELTIADETGFEIVRGNLTGAADQRPRQDRANARRAGRDVPEPEVLHRVEAVYPDEARSAGASGSVIVEVLIDRSGFVVEAAVVKAMGHGLSEAAVEAVKQWQFAPSMLDRVPVPVTCEVTLEFRP
jgi:TonB family protein